MEYVKVTKDTLDRLTSTISCLQDELNNLQKSLNEISGVVQAFTSNLACDKDITLYEYLHKGKISNRIGSILESSDVLGLTPEVFCATFTPSKFMQFRGIGTSGINELKIFFASLGIEWTEQLDK